jgi:ribonuclease D
MYLATLDWERATVQTVQVYVSGHGVEVVRLGQAGRPSSLLRLLADRQVVKIFHYAIFDLQFLRAAFSADAVAVCCTKIAAKLLFPNQPHEQRLAALTERYLDIRLDKTEQRSDWSAAELTEAQIAYAAADVRYLPDLMDRRRTELADHHLLDLAEDCWRHVPAGSAWKSTGSATSTHTEDHTRGSRPGRRNGQGRRRRTILLTTSPRQEPAPLAFRLPLRPRCSGAVGPGCAAAVAGGWPRQQSATVSRPG